MCRIFFLVFIALSLKISRACWKPATRTVIPQVAARDGHVCDIFTSNAQKKDFHDQISRNEFISTCAHHWWLKFYAELKLQEKAQHTTIVDVGCNKAYFSAMALNQLAPRYGNHLQLFYKSHLERGVFSKACGKCDECHRKQANGTVDPSPQVTVYCIEPSQVHMESVSSAASALYGPPDGATKTPGQDTKINFHVELTALSNSFGTRRFSSNCTGSNCKDIPKGQPSQEVNVSTVDAEMRSHGLSFVDILKISTDGTEPEVLAGAYETLATHKIGLLSIEYSNLWKQGGSSLGQCIRYLNDLGYTCYYDAPVLTKLSGTCWNEAYRMQRRAKLVCVIRGTKMEEVLYNGSYLARKHRKKRSERRASIVAGRRNRTNTIPEGN